MNGISVRHIQCRENLKWRVSKRMTRFQVIISNNENVLQLQNKLQTIESSSFTHHNYKCPMCPPPAARTTTR